MCILIAIPPDCEPEVNDLWDAIEQNPDGHGWAIRTNGTIEKMVTMDGDRALGAFLSARQRWPHSWGLWHSRFATQGLLDTSNCQPFDIPGTGWVMGHNGILPLSDGPWDDRRSDSRILAEDHLSGTSWAALRHSKDELDHWLSPSKVVVMSPRKEKGGPVIIYGENRGQWAKDGCWWSARPYWPVTKVSTSYLKTTTLAGATIDADEEEEDEDQYWNESDAGKWDAYQQTLARLDEDS